MDASELEREGWPCPTAAEMQAVDRFAIDRLGLPGRLLMENAGRACAAAIRERFPGRRRPLVLCGTGNNGGDGFVIARLLREADHQCVPLVVTLGAPKSPESVENFDLLSGAGVERLEVKDADDLCDPLASADLVIDGLFGVGLARPVEGKPAEVLERIRRSGIPCVAIDVPSTLSSDTGQDLGPALEPDLILTLGLPKLGLALRAGDPDVRVCDIGLPAEARAAVHVPQRVWTRSAARGRLPRRSAGGHKGTFGHVLVVGGSTGKTGAAALAATGALHAGAGLVTAAVPASLNPILEVKLTEAMTLPVAEGLEGAIGAAGGPGLLAAARDRDCAVVGPGLGTDPGTVNAVEALLGELEHPAVVDADALNAYSGRVATLAGAGPRVLTPHPGEAARLLGCSVPDVQRDRAAAARALAASARAVCLLKGARSVIARPDGELRVNPTGGPALATGGTGDVLAGVIGALLAQGLDVFDAAALGAYLHGLAGDLGPAVGGTASQLAARLPDAWRSLASTEDGQDGPSVVRRFA